MEHLSIVAMGPDAAGLLTLEAAEALANAGAVLLRTRWHGVAGWLEEKGIHFDTLDALYESAEDFDALSEVAADEIIRRLSETPALCYCVPDPLTDETVRRLSEKGIRMRVLPGVTQGTSARAKAIERALPVPGACCEVPAVDFAVHRIDPSEALLITEINSRLLAGEVKLRLLSVYKPGQRVLLSGEPVALEALDRGAKYDHLTSVYLPPVPLMERDRFTFGDLLEIMARLRRPGDGCPWDLEQTHASIRESVIEEAYELVETINQQDDMRIADELGDVMLQVVFHAQMAREHQTFDIDDVTTAICSKLILRHAHIFGSLSLDTAEEVITSWEKIKKKEKGLETTTQVMRDVAQNLPALMRAAKVQKKARQVGFDWDSPLPALLKVLEEAEEVRAEIENGRDPEEELGDLLFAAANVSRLAKVQPELALARATEKFIRRFDKMEQAVLADGRALPDMTLPEMDEYWNRVKEGEKA